MRIPFLGLPLARMFGPGITVLGVLALIFLAITGRLDLSKLTGKLDSLTVNSAEVTPAAASPATGDEIIIATFNIQTFGESKTKKPEVMAQLAAICKLFDVVAIQEIRSPHADPIGNLLALMNQDGSRYDAVVSHPIGRPTSPSHREQYAYVFDSGRIRVDRARVYVMNDELDRMHREPYVASFSVIPPPDATRAPFTFTLISAHTDPDEVSMPGELNELNVLADVYENVRQWEYQHYGEDDFILLGDLNAPRTKFFRLGEIPGLISVAPPGSTMVLGDKENDHILIDSRATAEFTRLANVLNIERDLQLSPEFAKTISDHCPVWAQFSAYEMGPADPSLARVPAEALR